jgi:hypothetical protein
MAGVDGVGTFGFVRPIGAHLAHQFARSWIEQVVFRFIGGFGGEQ